MAKMIAKTFEDAKNKKLHDYKIKIEMYQQAGDVVVAGANRKRRFGDEDYRERVNQRFAGVKSFEEACQFMREGYEPTVEALKKDLNPKFLGNAKRTSFANSVVGFQPIVPLAIRGVPQNMIDVHTKPIKTKVIDLYYDLTANCNTTTKQFLDAGEVLLKTVLNLEAQGYRFNLYATQNYTDKKDTDMLCVKVKDSNTPFNIRRMSFSLTHPGFFRCIGFDWYTRCPTSKSKSGYGHSIFCEETQEECAEIFKEAFGNNCVVLSAYNLINAGNEEKKIAYVNKVLGIK